MGEREKKKTKERKRERERERERGKRKENEGGRRCGAAITGLRSRPDREVCYLYSVVINQLLRMNTEYFV